MSNAAKKRPKSSAERVADFRKRMRAAGLVPRTIWVPDTKHPSFLKELDRECRAIAASERHDAEVNDWLERAYEGHDLGPIPPYRLPKQP